MKSGKLNVKSYVEMTPRSSTGVPNNSMFVDVSDNVAKLRDNSGNIQGLSGYSGPNGINGSSGYSGVTGSNGASGYSGVIGAGLGGVQVFTSSGTWSFSGSGSPSKVWVELVGGGAGGKPGSGGQWGGGGGGAGGYAAKLCSVSDNVTVTIGAGGAASGNGGTTSFVGFCSGDGGTTGSTYAGGSGGAGSSGDINITGGDGFNPMSHGTNFRNGGNGGVSFYGGGGRGAEGLTPTASRTGQVYGSGGGGGGDPTVTAAAAGKDGIVIVRW
jgi:hypothetical protein